MLFINAFYFDYLCTSKNKKWLTNNINHFWRELLPSEDIFDVANKIEQIKDDEAKTLAPNFWNDQLKAQALMKEIKQNKHWVSIFKNVENQLNDLNVLVEFQELGEATDEEIDAQYEAIIEALDENEFKSTLKNEEDNLSAIIEINAGAGGTEACDWASMLMRMYSMWANKNV